MDAKLIRKETIDKAIKPLFKSQGYKLNGNTFKKEEEDFYKVVTIQNFSWNNEEEVEFCFNIGILVKETELFSALSGNFGAHKCHIQVRENLFLPINRRKGEFRERGQYRITSESDIGKVKEVLTEDLTLFILKELEALKTLEDCKNRFIGLDIISNRLIKAISDQLKSKKQNAKHFI